MKIIFKILGVIIAIIVLVFVFAKLSGKNILPGFFDEPKKDPYSQGVVGESFVGKVAPFFDIPNIDGSRIKSTNFIDKPTVFIFWATWSKESIDQIKILDDYILSNNPQKSLVSFLAINSQEDQSIVKSFIRRGGYDIPFALDKYGDVSEDYGLKSVPTSYFVDKNGVIRDVYIGTISQDMFTDKIESIL